MSSFSSVEREIYPQTHSVAFPLAKQKCCFFQTIKSQQEQIEFLRKENSRQGEELHKLKCEAASPPADRDAELARLRKEISQLQRNKETQVRLILFGWGETRSQ